MAPLPDDPREPATAPVLMAHAYQLLADGSGPALPEDLPELSVPAEVAH